MVKKTLNLMTLLILLGTVVAFTPKAAFSGSATYSVQEFTSSDTSIKNLGTKISELLKQQLPKSVEGKHSGTIKISGTYLNSGTDIEIIARVETGKSVFAATAKGSKVDLKGTVQKLAKEIEKAAQK